ncbi:MAG: hypothetical protein ACLFSE_06775 [Spirochaetia bacterium]
MGESELTRIAEGLRFHNIDNNSMSKLSYLAEVKDERVLEAWETIAAKEQAEAGVFSLSLDGTAEARFSKTDAGPGGWCSISYMNGDYPEVKPYLNYPVMMYESVYSAFKLASASVSFRPYQERKTVRYSLGRKKSGTEAAEHSLPERISVQAHGLPREAARFPKEDMGYRRRALPYTQYRDI